MARACVFLASLLALLALLAGCGSLASDEPTPRPTARPLQGKADDGQPAQATPGALALPEIPADDPRALGDPNAPITLVEYSDFE